VGSRNHILFISVLCALALVSFSYAATITSFNQTGIANATFSSEEGGTDQSISINMPWKSNVTNASFTARGETSSIIVPPALTNGFAGNAGIFVADDTLYVVDDGRHRVRVYGLVNGQASAATYEFQIGTTDTAGNTNVLLDNPYDVFVNDSAIFVSDEDNHRIIVYNLTGTYLYTIAGGGSGSGNNQLFNPRGIEVDANYVYVADSSNNRIQIFYHNATYFHTITGPGSGFDGPSDVAVDPAGEFIYVVDTGNQVVEVFTSSFNYASKRLGTLDSSGTASKFSGPEGVDVNADDVYVTDTSNHRVAIWTIDDSVVPHAYSYRTDIGIAGVPADEGDSADVVKLRNPIGIEISGSLVYVSDTGMNRVLTTRSSYPANVTIRATYHETVDWTDSGNLTGSKAASLDADLLTTHLNSCSQVSGNCTILLEVTSDAGGVVYLEGLNITYAPIPQSHVNGTLGSFGARFNFSQSGVDKTVSSVGAGQAYDLYVSKGTYTFVLDSIVASQSYGHTFSFFNTVMTLDEYENQVAILSPGTASFSLPDKDPVLLANVSLGVIGYEYAVLNFSWSGQSVPDESKIALYSCARFDAPNNECDISWAKEYDTSLNTGGDYISLTTSEPESMYAIIIEELEQMYVNVTTDKASYTCGNSVALVGSVNGSSGSMVPSANVYVSLRNGTDSLMSSTSTITNANGAYSAQVEIPLTLSSSTGADTFEVTVVSEKTGFVNGSVTEKFGVTCCSLSYPTLCTTNTTCIEANGYWCDTVCQSVACGTPCGSTACGACTNQTACESVSCNWCSNSCQVNACSVSCSSENLGLCVAEVECQTAGGVWYASQCYSADQTCSALYLGLCADSSTCNAAGGEWCGSVCKTVCASVGVEQVSANETATGEGNYTFRVRVTNEYDSDMSNTTIIVHGINSEWYSVAPHGITLKPGESETFSIMIVLPANDSINNYDISYSISSDVGSRKLQTAQVEILPTINLPPKVFTTFVILNDLVTAGNRVNFRVQLLNAREEPTTVNVTYRVKKGNTTVVSKSESHTLEDELTFAQTLQIPPTTLQGKYVLEIESQFGSFKTTEENAFDIQLARPWIIFGMLLFIAVILAFYVYKFRGKLRQIGEVEEAYSGIDWEGLKKK